MNKHEHHTHPHTDTKNIGIAFIINLLFTIIEIVGGILTNSIAILSDALHDFGDTVSLGISYYLERKSYQPENKIFSYGYRRLSILSALLNALILIVGSLYILSEAIPRLLNPEAPNTTGMIWISIVGILFNGLAAYKLSKGESINQRMVMLHMMEDVLGWTAVLIGSVVMHFYNVPILDPILSLLIMVFILKNVYSKLKESLMVLLQTTPKDIDIKQLEIKIMSLSNIKHIHNLHLWSMDGQYHIFSFHLVVELTVSHEEIKETKELIRNICKEFKIEHVTIEVEYEK